MTTKRSVIVAATVSQTITNSDYRASANGNFSATGAPSVVTLIEAETTQPVRVYLPVLLKKLASSLK